MKTQCNAKTVQIKKYFKKLGVLIAIQTCNES
jgi:hypothetical protein